MKANNPFHKTVKQPAYKTVRITEKDIMKHAETIREFTVKRESVKLAIVKRACEYAFRYNGTFSDAAYIVKGAVTNAIQDANAAYYEGKPW